MRFAALSFCLLLSGNSVLASSPHQRFTKRADDTFGLSELGTKTTSGIYIGFQPDWAIEGPVTISKRVGKPASILGSYAHPLTNDTSFSEIDGHANAMLPFAATTVFSPAILSRFKLTEWTPAHTSALAAKMKELNDKGLKVWLRFAYEMNGNWMQYGQDPANFIRVWKEVHDAVKAVAKTTYFLWAPNVKANDPDGLYGYTQYYPGAEYVDIAGVDLYWLGQDQSQNTLPAVDYFSSSFKSFYDLYAPVHPIIIAETGAPYHYIPTGILSNLTQDSDLPGGGEKVDWSTQTPAPGGASEKGVKEAFFDQLASSETKTQFPALLALMYFNVAKIGGPAGHALLNDFRIIKEGNDSMTALFRSKFGDQQAYEAGQVQGVPDASLSSKPASPSATSATKTGAGHSLRVGWEMVSLGLAIATVLL